MVLIGELRRRIYQAVAELRWSSLGLLALLHALLSYVLLLLAGEAGLTASPIDYIYYYVTTATTVGYGDLSPATASGRVVGALVVLPGSIAIFTGVLGKAIADLGALWRREMNGFGDFSDRQGHTIVVGWQGMRSRRLLDLLQADRPDETRIVLVAKTLERNPAADHADFVRVDSLSSLEGLARAGAAGAASILVRGQDDDETLAAALAAHGAAGHAHIVAHFEDEPTAKLLARQCPNVEALGSLSAELLVRSLRDPGASRMAERLFSAQSQDTAFSLVLPDDMPSLRYLDAMIALKRTHGITLVGLREADHGAIDLNCEADRVLRPGESLFYIADARLPADAVDWPALAGDKVAA